MTTTTVRPISLSDNIERPPGSLKPWPNNPRTHPQKQLTKLKALINHYGFNQAVLIDEDDTILCGHGRVLAALELGLATVTTRCISGLSQSEKRAYVIGDNKLAMLSSWNPSILKDELQLLVDDDFEIEMTGFSTAEVDVIFDDVPGRDPDDLREADAATDAVTIPGDLWILGNHRLLCGDSLDSIVSATVLDGESAQMIITDPPYNLRIEGHVGNKGKIKHREFAMAAGEMLPVQYIEFLTTALRNMYDAADDGAIVYVFMDGAHIPELLDASLPIFGRHKQVCLWVKDNAGMGTFYRSQHEHVFVFKKGDKPHINNFELGQHGRYRTNVWTYPGAATFAGQVLLALHPTVKPTAMIADAIRDCSHRKGIIFDPFAGSGTILVAAERTGRCARAIELDPGYVDVAINRWQRVTGKQATLSSTGQSWDEVRAQRLPSHMHEVQP